MSHVFVYLHTSNQNIPCMNRDPGGCLGGAPGWGGARDGGCWQRVSAEGDEQISGGGGVEGVSRTPPDENEN